MKIQTYNDMKLQVFDKSVFSQQIMQFACDVTQKRVTDISERKMGIKLAKFLLTAEHTSVFEHSSITFLASGISRSLLAQVTRQRMWSFTSASQHYQNYADYPMSIRPDWDKYALAEEQYLQALHNSLDCYLELIKLNEKPEEARQVLPNACTVNLLITANPRSIAEFLRARLCWRNTEEMKCFATKLLKVCMKWIPEIFCNVEAPCVADGKCNQGRMTCGRKL